MLDFSHCSSRRSRLSIKSWELVSSLVWIVLKVPIVSSIGSITSTLYVKMNGVSCVPILGVVPYDHNTVGSSSAQLPLAFPSHFLIPFGVSLCMTITSLVVPQPRGVLLT